MHLIRNIEGFIEDLEHGHSYEYQERIDGETGITVRSWHEEAEETLADFEHAAAFWAYLESQLKFDATKAQDAPNDIEIFAEEARQDYEKLHAIVEELKLGDAYNDFVVDTVVNALRKAYAQPAAHPE